MPSPAVQIDDVGCSSVAKSKSVSKMLIYGNIARRVLCEDSTIWDTDLPGFGLRIRASGYKSWILKVQERKRTRFITIGAVAKVDAPTARQQARRVLERIALDGLPRKAAPTARTGNRARSRPIGRTPDANSCRFSARSGWTPLPRRTFCGGATTSPHAKGSSTARCRCSL